jgi:2-oxo-3-hexenedioate decarboxylase
LSTSALPASGLAHELFVARANRTPIAIAPSARDGGLDLDRAYAVEAELMALRISSGCRTVGRKVGFANKAMWRVLKLQTLVWAHMYDDTVKHAQEGAATLSTSRMVSPRIEPEVVFKLKQAPAPGADAEAVLAAVEWIALGFEIVDCPFPDWKFQPADFVACFGLHAALVVGPPSAVNPGDAERLASLTIRLSKDEGLVEEGYGRNALRNPVLCLAELASAIAGRAGMEPLAGGDLISTGTLTAAHPIGGGERWQVTSEGGLLAPLALRVL